MSDPGILKPRHSDQSYARRGGISNGLLSEKLIAVPRKFYPVSMRRYPDRWDVTRTRGNGLENRLHGHGAPIIYGTEAVRAHAIGTHWAALRLDGLNGAVS